MSIEQEPMYDPMKPVTPWREIGDLIILDIDRHPDDQGKNWHDNYLLIENIVCRDSEVALSAMHAKKELLHVALIGELYDVDQLEVVDTRFRQLIGKVAAFDSASYNSKEEL